MIGLLISVLQQCRSTLVKPQSPCKHHMSISIELNLILLQEERSKLHAINTAKQCKAATLRQSSPAGKKLKLCLFLELRDNSVTKICDPIPGKKFALWNLKNALIKT